MSAWFLDKLACLALCLLYVGLRWLCGYVDLGAKYAWLNKDFPGLVQDAATGFLQEHGMAVFFVVAGLVVEVTLYKASHILWTQETIGAMRPRAITEWAAELWMYFKGEVLKEVMAEAERQEANRKKIQLSREAVIEELNALFREGA